MIDFALCGGTVASAAQNFISAVVCGRDLQTKRLDAVVGFPPPPIRTRRALLGVRSGSRGILLKMMDSIAESLAPRNED